MEVNALGPLAVRVEGQAEPLGGRRQRTVLGLLISRPAGLTMDQLIAGSYGPGASPTARRSIGTFISRFRATLGPETIVRTGSTFVFNVAPESIDIRRFEYGIARAGEVSVDEPSLAWDLLSLALGEWQGEPFVDLEPFGLEAEARRLEALRWRAIKQRVQIGLDLERHEILLPEIEFLVAEEPWREHLRAAHAIVLYRCGRQADAIDACRSAIEEIREELGIEPTAELKELETQLLRHDPRLAPPVDAGRPKLTPVPWRYTSFVGRTADLVDVAGALTEHRLVVLTGPGGIGKSSLAAEVGRQQSRTILVAWVPIEAERESPPAHTVAASVGLHAAPGVNALDLIRSAIGEQPTLLILDGCEHVIDQLAGVVDELLSMAPSIQLLLTSRKPLGMVGEHLITVPPLDVGPGSSAARLFSDRAGLGDVDQQSPDTQQLITGVVQRVAGHPLAVELAATAARTVPLDELLDQLDDQPTALRVPRSANPRHISLTAALDWSYRSLDDERREAFIELAAFPTGAIAADGADAVLTCPDSFGMLRRLAEHSLVSPVDEDGRAHLLEPIRQYAAHRLAESGTEREVRLRHARWLVRLCERVDELMLSGAGQQGLMLLREESQAIVAVCRWAIHNGNAHDVVLNIASTVGSYWFRVADCAPLSDLVLTALSREPEPLRPLAVRALARAAFLLRFDRTDMARELYERVQAIAYDDTDHETARRIEWLIPALMHTLDRTRFYTDEAFAEEAIRLTQSVAQRLESLGYPAEPPSHGMAISLEALGRLDEAEAVLTSRAEWAGDKRPAERGVALEFRAMFATTRGDHDAALADSQEAVRLLTKVGDADFAASAEAAAAWAHANAEDYEAAAAAIERSTKRWATIGLPSVLEQKPGLVAVIAAGRRDWTTFLHAARHYFRTAPNPDDAATCVDYQPFLVGERGTGFHFARLIVPTAAWLVATDRLPEAAALVAAAPMAFECSAYQAWESIGEVSRVSRLRTELEGWDPPMIPVSLDELFRALHNLTSVG